MESKNSNKSYKKNETYKIPQEAQTLNYNQTKHKTPMGSVGNLVGVFPVVLAEFETDIYCELKYKYPIHSVTSKENKVIIRKFKLISQNKKLLIDGYVEKKLSICFDSLKKEQDTIITIPFKTVINIDYALEPKYDTEFKTNKKDTASCEYFFSPAERLFWIHEYTRLTENFEELESYGSKEYVAKLIVTLGISILQNQKVFIPEPSDEANVIAEYDVCRNQKNLDVTTHIEVGSDPEKGLIARIIKQ
ncbi:MAG: hypothetical protein ACRC6T_13465 [Sarcina sp.]